MLHILFTFCELTLFTHHKENDMIDVFIGSNDYDGALNSFCMFLTEELGLRGEKNVCPFVVNSGEYTIQKNRIPFEVVERIEYQNIREIAHESNNDELRALFVESKKYFKASCEISVKDRYYIDFMFRTRKNGNYYFSNTSSISLKREAKFTVLKLNKIKKINLTEREKNFSKIMKLYNLN
ncbi:uncharacterized protein VNE69_03371 [Vairimorpha necatrix]|uniref:Uncharacterized protein n=1 Tax=Vairimorpha necatrix TaxID=6039 RepID=A0AAX4JB16_9MICR